MRRGALVGGFCVWKKPCEEEEERSRGLVGFLEEESWIEVVVSVSKPASTTVGFGHEIGFESETVDQVWSVWETWRAV